jgi:hypothetical protein
MTPRKQDAVKFLESLVGQRFNTATLESKLTEHFNEKIEVYNASQGRIDSGEDDDELSDWNLMFDSKNQETYGYFDIYMLPMRRTGFDGADFYVTEVSYEFDGGEDD